jgi:hypothetical protein
MGQWTSGVKRPGREADHSPPTNAEVKSTWIHTSTPPVRLHGVMRNVVNRLSSSYGLLCSLQAQTRSLSLGCYRTALCVLLARKDTRPSNTQLRTKTAP